jgi:hypothetical protein
MGLPEPVFQTPQITLYQGDACALLPLMEPASVQLQSYKSESVPLWTPVWQRRHNVTRLSIVLSSGER